MNNKQSTTSEATSYYKQDRRPLLSFIPKSASKLLDIGCGAGSFGKMIKQNQEIEVWGVEPINTAANLAKASLDKVYNSFFDEKIELPEQFFDVIMFNDSLEHFPYPQPPLLLAQKYLNDNGKIILSIPNVRYIENIKHLLLEKDWKYTDSGILDNTHLRFFTKKSMARTIEETGYKIESIQGINPHHWSGWKIKLLDFFFHKIIEDMKYLQYVIVASKSAS